jgi:LacI family transcriptional regulator
MAIGALHAIVQAGLRPGRDISLLGCDDIPVSALVNPPLTTLRIPFRELGAVAQNLLLAIEGKGNGLWHTELPVLVLRST